MKRRRCIPIITVILTFFMASLLVCPQTGWTGEKQPAGEVIIFNAGSLTIPFAKMEKEFEARKAEYQKAKEKTDDIKHQVNELEDELEELDEFSEEYEEKYWKNLYGEEK